MPQTDAASTIFDLPEYRVIDAVDLFDARRRIVIESSSPPACPQCAVIAEKVLHSRRGQRVRDIPLAGPTEVVWAKRRFFCAESQCTQATFAEATVELPRFARSTTRLKTQVVLAVIDSHRSAAEVARAHGVSWWLV